MTEAKAQSQSTTKLATAVASTASSKAWTGSQAYLLAALCLLLGVALGYLFRGSASPAAQTEASTTSNLRQGSGLQNQQPDPAAQAALAQAAAPLLDAVNKDANDFDSLVKLGNLYYDGQQFPNAIQYYERALAIHPDNPDVRTDMGTAYWYTGDAEKALAAMETSLKYRPGHPQTLFNLGWVRWQGKQDPKGAIEAWQQLLKANPDYPQRPQVEQYIAKAKEHASRG
ncbi:MAG TPA: tetratricopeptide repeat protein [Candidatus Sulfotelmatobacter sp.]|nr:tetratricopeptide repeat protein [Candidatus Sulfotelmatobacter sp.]